MKVFARSTHAFLLLCIALLWGSMAPAADLEADLEYALELHKGGDPKQAIELYSKYIEKNPGAAHAVNWRGLAYLEMDELTQALANFNRAISISSTYADAYNNRGEVYRRKKDFANALKDFQRAAELEPEFAEPYYNIGLIYEAQGKNRLAANQFLQYLKAKPGAPDKKELLEKIRNLAKKAPPSKKEAAASDQPAPGKPPAVPPVASAKPPAVPEKPAAPGEKPPVTPATKPPAPGEKPPAGPPKKPPVPAAQPAPPPKPEKIIILGVIELTPEQLRDLPVSPETVKSLAGAMNSASESAGILGLVIPIVVLYVIFELMLFLIAGKTGVGLPWLAFIPVIQVYPWVKSAGKPAWWIILLLIPVVNILIALLIWLGIARERRKSALWGILAFLPCTTPLGMAYLAFTR